MSRPLGFNNTYALGMRPELADSLGIPQGTVMSRLFHARRRLRERLENHIENILHFTLNIFATLLLPLN